MLHLESSSLDYNGRSVELTKNELKILYYLFKNGGKICSRGDMIEYLWDNQLYVDDNALSVNINRIREKLAGIGLTDFIKTKHRQGVHDMNSRRYWKNRLPFLLTNLVCMAALTVFLLVCGNSVSAVVLILIVWALILLTGLVLTYWKRKRQMKKLLDMAEQLSERYLISEVMELPEQYRTEPLSADGTASWRT